MRSLSRALTTASWAIRHAQRSYTCQLCLVRIPYQSLYAAQDAYGSRVCLACFDQYACRAAKTRTGRDPDKPIAHHDVLQEDR